MTDKNNLYLKQNVLVEPLFNQWYAWSYLISPATAAMYIANLHLKVMQSFVDAPQVHTSASNYDKSRVNEMKALMEKTRKQQAHMLELAEAIKTIDNILMNEADGYPLEPLYAKVPDVLRGYVELVYDLNNHPSIRFIEGLLYKSPYYQTSSQSIALSIIDQDDRPFRFSTPRLKEDRCLHLNIAFMHKGLDELFKMKNNPNKFDFVKDILGVNNKEDDLLSFFTDKEPHFPSTYDGDAIRIRYFGHACILIEYQGISILCDPLINYQYNSEVYHYSYVDLPEKIDYILITHQHQDHCSIETLLQLRHKTRNVIVPKTNSGGLADPSMKLVLQNIGFKNVIEIDEMETITIEKGKIVGLPFLGEHAGLNIRTKISFLVCSQEKSILIGSDSNTVEPKLFEHIHDAIGNIDVLFLGVPCDGAPLTWAYGSLLTRPLSRKIDEARALDGSSYERAMDLVNCLKPQKVYVYAMGYEPWLSYLISVQSMEDSHPSIQSLKLIEDCRSRSIAAERLFGHKEIFLK